MSGGDGLAFAPAPRDGDAAKKLDAQQRCRSLLSKLPPMEGSVKYKLAWGIEGAFEQHQNLMRQHELQSSIGENHVLVRREQVNFAAIEATAAQAKLRELVASGAADAGSVKAATKRAREAAAALRVALKQKEIEEQRSAAKTVIMEGEIEKSNQEMVSLREAIDDVASGGGPPGVGVSDPAAAAAAAEKKERTWYYCSDCKVGGHGQRFASYLLKRPNWRIYPSEKWFEDKNGQVSHCPLGRRGVDFADETHFSRIAMHIKGRIWLEDKRKLYEFVPDVMPFTYVIQNGKWVGDPPPPEPPDMAPMPWFVKETDRNFGTSVVCCQTPEECMGLTKPDATYVVQRHIPDPLLYDNGEKCHIKFYNLLVGHADGVTWSLYTYKDGYLSISPKAWSPTDMSKETQVTIIRTKRINDWAAWPIVYPKCRERVQSVIQRAAEQGKLEGRNKIQFEIISADFIVASDYRVWMLEFNTGPVLKDPEAGSDVHDAGMIDGALSIIEPWAGGDIDKWDFVFSCKGVPPKPDEGHAIDAL